MGLDGVELVMEFEETFGVELEDDKVTEAVTPRMIGDLIFSKLKVTDERICQSQRAFYILRNVLIKMFVLERKSVTPDMQFRDLMPKEREKEMWEQIRLAVAARSWPKLALPLWMSRFLIGATVAILSMIVYAVIRYSGLGFIGAVALAVVLARVANELTRPHRVCIPSRFNTIRDLIPYAITSDQIKWTREQVSDRMKQIVTEQFDLDESEYTEDSRFLEDFGIG
jgi:acyl carrier protein